VELGTRHLLSFLGSERLRQHLRRCPIQVQCLLASHLMATRRLVHLLDIHRLLDTRSRLECILHRGTCHQVILEHMAFHLDIQVRMDRLEVPTPVQEVHQTAWPEAGAEATATATAVTAAVEAGAEVQAGAEVAAGTERRGKEAVAARTVRRSLQRKKQSPQRKKRKK